MAISLGDAVLYLNADMKGLNKALNQAKFRTQRGLGAVLETTKKVGVGMTAMGAAGAAGFAVAVKSAMDFRSAMAEVNTLGIEDLGALSDAVMDVSATFGLDLVDGAKAAYQAISAGASEAEAPKVLEASARAAAAGVTDMATAVDLGMGTVNAFGMQMGEINTVFDQAFVAVKKGVTTFGELGASVGQVAPTFAAAKLGSDEMFASVAALTKAGISTSQSVTGIKAALANIIKPTSDAQKAAAELGVEFNTQALASQGLKGFLDSLATATGGNVDQMARFFGSVEGLNAVLALTGTQAQSFGAILEETRNATGATQTAFDALVASDPSFAWRQLRSEMQALLVQIGTALLPVLKRVVDAVKPVIAAVVDWVKAHPDLTKALVITTAAVTAFMLALGPVLIALPGLVAGFKIASAAWAFFGLSAAGAAAGLATALATIGLVIAGLVAVGGIVWALLEAKKAWDGAAASQEQADQSTNRMIETLKQQGVNVEGLSTATMSHNEIMAELTRRVSEAEQAQRREISAINGVTQEFVKQVPAASAAAAATAMTTGTIDQLGQRAASATQQVNGLRQALAGLGLASPGGAPGAPPAGFAHGGVIPRYAAGGLHPAIVGEMGPEAVMLPVGSRVLSARDTRQALAETAPNINISITAPNAVNLDERAADRIGRQVAPVVSRELAAAFRRGRA